jgi:LysM repeat protein
VKERPIRFPNHARSADEAELMQAQRRRREAREAERGSSARRVRRRRQSTPWLQRNALGVAAVSILVAFLGLGFGLMQVVNRPEAAPTLATVLQPEPTFGPTSTTLTAASLGPGGQLAAPAPAMLGLDDPTRPIHTSVRVLEANYTIVPGDTLVQIAQRFNTSVDRIQAFNNLADPRALRIGTKLIIPPPL